MARDRWLVLAGCLALLPWLAACGNTCLNPQPEPPGGGCSEADSRTGTRGPDAGAGFAVDASADRAPDHGPGGDSGPDVDADQREDEQDAAADPGPRDAASESPEDGDAEDGGANDAGDTAAGDAPGDVADEPRDAPGTDDAPDALVGDAQAQ